MTHYCLDTCSIINLFCGWGGIQELHTFGTSWSTTATALNEFTEVRIQQLDGTIIRAPIQHDIILNQYPLTVHSAVSEEELALLSSLSAVIDDGEAECLAIAKHRGMVFVSDDKLANLEAANLDVPKVSSLDLLIEWADLDPQRPARLMEIAHRIETLARYVPPRSHPRREWWDGLRGQA